MGISFYRGPVFAAICLAYFPVVMLMVGALTAISKVAAFKKMEANKALGGFSEEIISGLKLIVSFA